MPRVWGGQGRDGLPLPLRAGPGSRAGSGGSSRAGPSHPAPPRRRSPGRIGCRPGLLPLCSPLAPPLLLSPGPPPLPRGSLSRGPHLLSFAKPTFLPRWVAHVSAHCGTKRPGLCSGLGQAKPLDLSEAAVCPTVNRAINPTCLARVFDELRLGVFHDLTV